MQNSFGVIYTSSVVGSFLGSETGWLLGSFLISDPGTPLGLNLVVKTPHGSNIRYIVFLDFPLQATFAVTSSGYEGGFESPPSGLCPAPTSEA